MAITLCAFETSIVGEAGEIYSARACGKERDDHLWEGWIEFDGLGGEVLRSGRETTQPNLTDLQYWAQGLTPVYLEGAFSRALELEPVIEPPPPPTYSGPAVKHPKAAEASEPEAILDPYLVYQQGGSDLLAQELSALNGGYLRQIVRSYLPAEENVLLDKMNKAELIALITERVRAASRSTVRQ